MQETTNYRFKKIGLDDSPPDITATNPNWDEADRILKEHEEGIETLNLSTESINEQLGEVENKKINYTDLTPVVTTGTASAYVATIPANVTEVTIVPHVNNLDGATLNDVPILDREGKPIEKDVLKINIPTKLVRVGSNFFIASSSGGGSLSTSRWRVINGIFMDDSNMSTSTSVLIGANDKYVIYDCPGVSIYRRHFVVVDRITGNIVCQKDRIDSTNEYFRICDSSKFGVIVDNIFFSVIYTTETYKTRIVLWDLTTNEMTVGYTFVDNVTVVTSLFKSDDGYIYGHDHTGIIAKISLTGELLLVKNLGAGTFGGYLIDDTDYIYFYKHSTRDYLKISKNTLAIVQTITLTGTDWTFQRGKAFVRDGKRLVWDGYRVFYFAEWNMNGNATYTLPSSDSIMGMSKDYLFLTGVFGMNTSGVSLIRKLKIEDGTYMEGFLAKEIGVDRGEMFKYGDDHTFIISRYRMYDGTNSWNRYGDYFEY